MALDGFDVARLLVVVHWLGMLLGLGAAATADVLGLRILLSTRPGPSRKVFKCFHLAIGLAILTLLFSGAGLIVLRADRWCQLPDNVMRAGPVCLPYKLAVKITLMLALVGTALLIDAHLLPLSRRTERPLIVHLSWVELVRAGPIGAASLTCWVSLASIPFVPSLHSWLPLELIVTIAIGWVVAACGLSMTLIVLREIMRRTSAGSSSMRDAAARSARSATSWQVPLDSHAARSAEIVRLADFAVDPGRARAPGSPGAEPLRPGSAPLHARRQPDKARTGAHSTGAHGLDAAFASSWRTVLGTLAISFVINALMLTGPLYMLQVYDRVLTSRSTETLLVLTLLVVGLFAVMGLLDQIRARILTRISLRIDRLLAPQLLAASVRVAPAKSRAGAQPLRDLDQIRGFIAGPAPAAMLDLPWAPVYFALVFLLHPVLGLVALGGAVVLVALSIVNQVLTRKPLAKSVEGTTRCEALADAGSRGAEAMRALGMTGTFGGRWHEEHTRTLAHQLRANDVGSSVSAATRTARLLLQSLLLGVGAHLALQDAVSAGAMIAASIIAARALAPVEQLVGSWRNIGSVRGALVRCRASLAALPAERDYHDLPVPRGALAVTNLYVQALGGAEPVLKGLNFRLEPGDGLAVIGPSAAGKSTLARALVGVWPIRHGDIRLDGATLDQWDPAVLGRHIGYLPQDVSLFEGTIAENIARLDPEPDPQAVLAAAKAAGVHEMILRLEQGYATRVAEGGASMPGGQRQRIALARALYGGPALVVMDEPNANLDAAGEAALSAAIVGLRRAGRTVIVIAHRRSVLSAVNRVLVLKDGRQAAFGPPEQILAAPRAVKPTEAINDNRHPTGMGARRR